MQCATGEVDGSQRLTRTRQAAPSLACRLTAEVVGTFILTLVSAGADVLDAVTTGGIGHPARYLATVPEQGRWLGKVVRGYFAYHAIPNNGPSLSAFRHYVTDAWRRALRRRSQRDHTTLEKMLRLANQWLPMPRILHPWPSARFAVKHPRWEPSA